MRPADGSVIVHLSRRTAVWLSVVVLLPWLAVAAWFLAPRISRPKTAAPLPAVQVAAPTRGATTTERGEWGELGYTSIMIEPPEEYVRIDSPSPGGRRWLFKGYDEARLAQLWHEAALTAEQLAYVAAPAHRETTADGIIIRPDDAFVIALTPEQRARIYTALGLFPENDDQQNPYRIRSELANEWLTDAGVPADAVALTQRLSYRKGTATCFADDAIVLPMIPDTPTRVKYIKALSRRSGYLLKLRVHHNENVDSLVAYWGRGGRSKDLRPLLQSLARQPDGGSIDVLHLLPRFARAYAYTYPMPWKQANDQNHDCHWTSLNFQNDEPDERFSDIGYVKQVLLEQYYAVQDTPKLGDIILFVRPGGVVIHSCVYIAGEFVFTKNGPAPSVPWLLTKLADVKAFYADDPSVEIRRFRAKRL